MWFIWKILSVIGIILLWWIVTCGWNLLFLNSKIASMNFLFSLWIIELFILLIYAIWKVFFPDITVNSSFDDSLLRNLEKSWIIGAYKEDDINHSLSQEWESQSSSIEAISTETQDLMDSLAQVDISDISSIIFLPKSWKWFQVKTKNIKRLAIYITTKLGKTVFEVEELRGIYNHVVKNLQSNLSKTDFNIVQGKINEFVQSGREVKIERI